MLRKKQVAPAAIIARKLEQNVAQLRDILLDVASAGLSEDYLLMVEAIRGVNDVRYSLDRKAREAFVAARRGEELPE